MSKCLIINTQNYAASSWKSCLKVLIIHLEPLPLLQSLPIHPSGHSHLYPPIKLMHLPPCKQGERVRHSSISVTVTFHSESFQSKDNNITVKGENSRKMWQNNYLFHNIFLRIPLCTHIDTTHPGSDKWRYSDTGSCDIRPCLKHTNIPMKI